MNHKTKTYRVLSWLLAMFIIVGLLPAQAFAASTDDPTTWIAPDEQYTAPGSSPVYIYLDRRDEENGGGFASHSCTSGAELSYDVVKATATTDGYLKTSCNTCGSWAQVTIPALTLDAFELDPAYRDAVENGVEYSGNVYTLVYNITPEMQRFIGTQLENHVAIVMPGTYHILITVDGSLYDNVQLTTNETLTVYPKRIPWTATFENKIYDGVSLLDGVSVTYRDVEGSTVPAVLSACLVKLDGGEIVPDEAAPATQPIAAGPYAIGATITDEKYVWQVDGGTYRTVYTPVWIMPVASDIYVGETISDVTLTTGGGSYTWTLDSGYSGFDSSRPGTTNVRATVSRTNGAQIAQVMVPVTVKARPIISVDPVTVNGSIGDAFSSLDLPDTVTVIAKGTNGNISVSGVPVTWDGSGYNSNLLTQTAPGTLRLTGFPQLSSENVPAFSANINLTYGSVVPPVIDPFSKVYDGNTTALPLPQMPAGVASTSVRYKGASNAGVAYESNTPPVNAGSYEATVSFTMQRGYSQLSNIIVPYTINKAPQTCDAPTLASATTTSLTLNTVSNAEYSKDGENWQASPEFRSLEPGMTYTLYQRLKATADGNYDVSPAASASFSTEYATVDPGDLSNAIRPQSYPYTGNPIPYQVPAISLVALASVSYNVDGQTTDVAPTDAGTYPVTITFTMQAGAAQLEPASSTLTITKVAQDAPAAPRASNTGTNSITIVNIPGAVFSIDGGNNWQSGTLFDNLDPDKDYTIQAKYPEDRNHYESPVSSSVIRTTRRSASAAAVQSAVYTYDGEPKSLVVDQPIGCSQVVQTFTGTNGTSYGPTTDQPVNPGVYNVKVSYTMENGYEELQPQYATLTILKATPRRPDAPVVTDVTDSSITIIVEEGCAYSVDGGVTWQTTDTFTGLNRDTTYEIKVKVVENTYYTELEGPSTMQATLKTKVVFEGFNDQTVEFTGYAQTYTLPRYNTGIASMRVTGYNGQSTAPSDVGDYEVSIEFVAADGYSQHT